MTNEQTDWVKIGEVAKHFGVSTSTIRKWVREGFIYGDAYINITGAYRFHIPAVEKCLTSDPSTTKEQA